MTFRAVQEGDRIGEYVLERKIGATASAEVWRGVHHVLATPAAVKVARTARGAGRLWASGQAQHVVNHPRVLRILGLDPDCDPPYLVVELGGETSLRDRMDREGPMDWPTLAPILQDVLEGLDAVHGSGSAHGNLKPANIVLDDDGRARLTDFGGPAPPAEDGAALSGVFAEPDEDGEAATDPYRAADGADAPTGDLWAFGVILFEALTGRRPAGAELPSEIAPAVPGEVDTAFRRCFVRADRRFCAAAEAKALLFPSPPAAKIEPARGEDGGIRILSAVARCPKCRHRNPVEYRFCVRCGVNLGADDAARETCRSCGQPRFGSSRFCPFCGTRFGKARKG